jgi:hypothetical protein
MKHECQELTKVNRDKETNCIFTIEHYQYNPTRNVWGLLNNNDDYYSPAYISFCPFCGEDLNKTYPNEIKEEP